MIETYNKYDLMIKNYKQAKIAFVNSNEENKKIIFQIMVNKFIITASNILKNKQDNNEYIKMFNTKVLKDFSFENLIAVLNSDNNYIIDGFIKKYSNIVFENDNELSKYIKTIDEAELETLNEIIVKYILKKYQKTSQISSIIENYDTNNYLTVLSNKYLDTLIGIILDNEDYESLITVLKSIGCFNLVENRISKDKLMPLLLKYEENLEPSFIFQIIFGNFENSTIEKLKKWLNYIKNNIRNNNDIKYFINRIETIVQIGKLNYTELYTQEMNDHIYIIVDYYKQNQKEILNNENYKKRISKLFLDIFLFSKDYNLFYEIALNKLWFLQTCELYDNEYIMKSYDPLLIENNILEFINSNIIQKKIDEHKSISGKIKTQKKYILMYLNTFICLFIDFDKYSNLINMHAPEKITLCWSISGILYYENSKFYLLTDYYKLEIDNMSNFRNFLVGVKYNFYFNSYCNGKFTQNPDELKQEPIEYDFKTYKEYLYDYADGNHLILKENDNIDNMLLLDCSARSNERALIYMNLFFNNVLSFKNQKEKDRINKILNGILNYMIDSMSTKIITYEYHINKDSDEKFNLSKRLISKILSTAKKDSMSNEFLLFYKNKKIKTLTSHIVKLSNKIARLKELDYQYYNDLILSLKEDNLLSITYCDNEIIEKDYYDFLNKNDTLKQFYLINKKSFYNLSEQFEKTDNDELAILNYIYINANNSTDEFLNLLLNINTNITFDDEILKFINEMYDIFYLKLKKISDIKKLIFFDIGSKDILNSDEYIKIYDKYSYIRKQIINNDINARNFNRTLIKLGIEDISEINKLDKFIDEDIIPLTLTLQQDLQKFQFYYKIYGHYDIEKIYAIMKKLGRYNYYNLEYQNDIKNIKFPVGTEEIRELYYDLIDSNLTLFEKLDFYLNSILKYYRYTSISIFLDKLHVSDEEINNCLEKYTIIGSIHIKQNLNKYFFTTNLLASRPNFEYEIIDEYNNFLSKYRFLPQQDEIDLQMKYDSSRSIEDRLYYVIKNPLSIIEKVYNILSKKELINKEKEIDDNEKIKVVEKFYLDLQNNIIDLSKYNEIEKFEFDEFLIRLDLPLAYNLNLRGNLDHYVIIADIVSIDMEKQVDALYIYLNENSKNNALSLLHNITADFSDYFIEKKLHEIQDLLYKYDNKDAYNLLLKCMKISNLFDDKYISQKYIDYINENTDYKNM